MTPQEFYSQYLPYAEKVSNQTGLDPRLVLAQAALETGYGKSAPNMNFFGIKSHGRKGGRTLQTSEFENGQMVNQPASFRGYESPDQSFQDYARFLKSNPRYGGVLSAEGIENQISAMAKSGYATDPNYGAKLANIAGKFDPSSPPIIASDAMRVLGKQPKGLLASSTMNTTESEMIPEQKPKGLLGGLFSDPDKRARLAMALEGMTLNPNQGMMASLQGGIEQRGEDRKEAAAEAKKLAQTNKSLEFLASQPGGEDYVRLAEAAGVPTAMKAYLENKKAPKETAPYSAIAKLQADFAAGRVNQEGYNLALAAMQPKGMSIRTNSDGTFELVQGAGVSDESFTEGETKNISFARRSSQALKLFDPVADSLVSSFESLAEMDPTGMARYFQSDEYQKAQILGKDFLAPILRKDTGAAVTPSEWVFYKAIYIPEVGDNPAKLAEKKAARARAVEAMKAGMSPSQILRVEGIDPNTAPEESGGSAPKPASGISPNAMQFMTPKEP